MVHTTAPRVTRDDYRQMPDGPPYYQVIGGDLVMSPSPSLSHQDVAGRLYAVILGFLEKQRLGEVFIAPVDVYLGATNVYQPDVVFVSRANRSRITDRGIEGPPDVVIEVLSATTARYDRGLKRKTYARTGVKELWLADPETRTIEVFRLAKDAETPALTCGPADSITTPSLPGLRVELAAVFRTLTPT